MPNYTVQLRRGTSAEHSSFTGAAGEITVNTSNSTIHVHDGSTAGGTELATKSSVDGLTVNSISDVTITTPSSGQVLQYNGSAWVNATDEDNLANNDTDDLAEGSTNQYYTDARARGAISVTGSGSYNSSTGVITVTGGVTSVNSLTGAVTIDTDDVAEGSTNQYYTDTRVDSRITANWLLDEDNMATNSATKFPSQQSVKAYVDAEVAGVVDAAPGALDTLNELAAALGDDANFSTTVTNSIATKLSKAGDTMSGDLNMGGNDITNAGTFNGTATSAQYADLAERYHSGMAIEAGSVVCFGGDHEIKTCDEQGCTAVAGVVSTAPAYMMNKDAGSDDTHPYVALAGRVPCKVTGSIKKGDLLMASSMAGHAMAGEFKGGAMIGKALENFDGESGVIEVLVNLM